MSAGVKDRDLVIADVALEFHDGPHATPPAADSGPIYLGIKNLTEAGGLDLSAVRHIAMEDFPRWTKRVTPQPGDLVFTYEATLHRYALIPEGFEGCLGRRLALIRPRLDVVDPTFLLLTMLSPRWRQTVEERIITGATVDRIPLVEFPSFPIRLPPLPAQRRIAAVLSSFDELIEINQRRIEIQEDLARSLYREWFVHFRFPGHEDVEFVGSELGPIPEGWNINAIGEVAKLRYGKSLPATTRRPGDIAVVSSAGIIDEHDQMLVEGPGVVIGRKGNVGSVWWVEGPFFPIDTTYYVESDLPLGFLYWLLSDVDFIDSHAAVPGLSREQAIGVRVVIPPVDIVQQFDEANAAMFRDISGCHARSTHLAATRDLLLPRLVTGQLDIADIDLGVLTPAETE